MVKKERETVLVGEQMRDKERDKGRYVSSRKKDKVFQIARESNTCIQPDNDPG